MLQSLIDAAREAERTGGWDEALRRYEAAFARLPREGSAPHAADLLRWIGTVHRNRGELDLAGELFQASLAVAEAGQLRPRTASALNVLATVEQLRGNLGEAEALYLRARSIAEAEDDARRVAMIDQNLGTLANIRGELATAVQRYRSALERFRALDDDLSTAWCLNNLGMAQVDAEEWDAAEESFDLAFSLAERLRHLATLGKVEINRGDLYLQRGDLARAREHCDRAFEIFGRLGSRAGLGEAHKLYGVLHREGAKLYLAEMHLVLAVEMARSGNDRLLEAEAERERGLVAAAQGQDREALACLSRAHQLFTGLQASREVLDIERRLDRLEEAYLGIVTRWSESIESADPHTAGHSQRVAELTCRIARALGIGERDRTALRVGALLHDIGIVTVPAEVLNKAEPLTPEEWELIREHPAAGDWMLADKGLPWDVRPMVRGHHERWDGRGYPDHLRGEAIPLAARILHIADVYDVLTHPRSYRPALSPDEALRVMGREAGHVLDPDLFAVFARIMTEQEGAKP